MPYQGLTAHTPDLVPSSFAMPYTDYLSMAPQDLSAQMMRTHQPRRLSSKSSTPSSSRRASRIAKFGVASNSPVGVQRRRTTANHSAYDQTYYNPRLSREQRLYNYYQARHSQAEVRPFSWHPGAEPPLSFAASRPTTQQPTGNALLGFENLAVTDTPPSVEQSIHDACNAGHSYPYAIPASNITTQAPSGEAFPPPLVIPAQESGYVPNYYQPVRPTNTADTLQGQSQGYQPEVLPYWRTEFYSNPDCSTAAVGSNRASPGISPNVPDDDEPETPIEEGEELIGIGLYDDKEPAPAIKLAYSNINGPALLNHGRDLKLEQTWQPPKDEDSQDVEAIEPDDPVAIAPSGVDAQPAFYQPYEDLSNQSFFFTGDDDSYAGAPHISDYVSVGSPWRQMDQWRAQPAVTGSFMII